MSYAFVTISGTISLQDSQGPRGVPNFDERVPPLTSLARLLELLSAAGWEVAHYGVMANGAGFERYVLKHPYPGQVLPSLLTSFNQ